MTDTRAALAAALEGRREAAVAEGVARDQLLKAETKLAEMRADLDAARAAEADDERDHVAALHRALVGGDDTLTLEARPAASMEMERALRPYAKLVERLTDELAHASAAYAKANTAADSAIDAVMTAEGEAIASELWDTRVKAAALTRRLEAMVSHFRSELNRKNPVRTVPAFPGSLLMVPTNLPKQYTPTAPITRALYDNADAPHGLALNEYGSQMSAEHAAWLNFRRDLQTNHDSKLNEENTNGQ